MSDKILILTEGESEEFTLGKLLKRANPNYCYDVRRTGLHPDSEKKAITRELRKMQKSIMKKKDDGKRFAKVILVIDFENHQECLAKCKALFEQCLSTEFHPYPCSVVFKFRKYENWIIADIEAISKCSGYQVSQAQKNQVVPNKADNVVDAVDLLSKAKSKGSSYGKTAGSQSIVPKLRVAEMEKNSRSFRKMLKEIGLQKYQESSRRYIP